MKSTPRISIMPPERRQIKPPRHTPARHAWFTELAVCKTQASVWMAQKNAHNEFEGKKVTLV
jgi:hypothetical protein